MKIIYLEDGTLAYENLNLDGFNNPIVYMMSGETRTVEVDWSQIGTVSTATATATGPTVSSATSSNTQTLTVSGINGNGAITLTMTDSNSNTHKRQILVNERPTTNYRSDYGG